MKELIIFNCNQKVKGIIEYIEESNKDRVYYDKILLIVQDKELWDKNKKWHPNLKDKTFLEIKYGSPTDESLLENIEINKAKAAMILTDPNHGQYTDAPSALTAMFIENKNPDIHTVVELLESSNRRHLDALHIIDEIICLGEVSEKMITQSAITHGVENIFNTLLTPKKNTPEIFIKKIPNTFIGKSFKDIFINTIKHNKKITPIGYINIKIKKENNNQIKELRYNVNPKTEYFFKKDDEIIYLGIKENFKL